MGIDYRSLTLFRQIIALLYIFLFFVIRVVYFPYFSVENGPFSNNVMKVIENPPILVNLISSDIGFIVFLAIGLIVGVILFLGIYTSISSFVAMVFYILSAKRFIPYSYGTDEIVIVCLFIIGFIYALSPKKQKINNVVSFTANPFLIVLFLQIALIYFCNGINKTSINWWSGEAVSMTLFNDPDMGFPSVNKYRAPMLPHFK